MANKLSHLKENLQTRKYRKLEGRIALYKDVSVAKSYLLDEKCAVEIAKYTQAEKLKLEELRFQTIQDPTAFDYIVNTKAKEKEAQLRKAYWPKKKKGEEVDEEALMKAIEEQIAKELAIYKEELVAQVMAQTSKGANIDLEKAEADYEQHIATKSEELKAKYAVQKEKWSKKYAHKVEKLEAKRNKLKEKLDVEEVDACELPDDVVLDVKDLCMFFGGVHAVEDLTFQVKHGEIFGLIGPNGAGKTTVFNCITQFYKPTRGELYFRNKQGRVIDLNTKKVHDIILEGIVRTFQNIEVVKEVSVLDNLLIAAHRQFHTNIFEHMVHSSKLAAEEVVIRQRAIQVLNFMGLTPYAGWYAMGLPYGILKKIEIARTLMCNPQLIILDEPAAGLNDTETAELAELIHKIKDTYNCTILLVEHDMGLVMKICDNICAISFGKKLAIGTPKEIQENADVQSAYLGAQEDE